MITAESVVAKKEALRTLIKDNFSDWTVRGVPSDHIPLTGSGALGAAPRHRFYLNENPLRIYLHFGGHKAVYFELVADSDSLLQHIISIVVQTRLPSNAFCSRGSP